MPQHTEKQLKLNDTIRALSDRLVAAQQDLRVLDAIKWDDSIEEQFFQNGCRELPTVDVDYYRNRPLPFDAEKKLAEFEDLELDIQRELGEYNPIGIIMRRNCH